jgi:two-component system NarL family sensor kinase
MTSQAEVLEGGFKARRLAWPIACISIGLVGIALFISLIALISGGELIKPPLHQLFSPIFGITYSMIGGLVASRRSKNPVGWISAFIGLFFALNQLAISYGMLGRSQFAEGSLHGEGLAMWVEQWTWFPPAILPMTFLLLLFPDGHLPSPRWKPVAWASAAGLIIATLLMAIVAGMYPGEILDMEAAIAILGQRTINVMYFTVALPLVIGVIGSVASLFVRFRGSKGIERQQLKWMAYAGMILILGILLGSALPSIFPNSPTASELGIVLTSVVQLGIVIAAAIAILKHHLYDVDILINRTLVYGGLTAITMGIYVLVVGYLGELLQVQNNSIVPFIATGFIAVMFQPLRQRLQGLVNRMMYGERDDPFSVISQLNTKLEAAVQPEVILPTLVETVAQVLKLPYVAIEVGKQEVNKVIAETGQSQQDNEKFPLTYQNEVIGNLIVGCRGPSENFTESELKLLRNIAQQAGAAVHAVHLTADLRRSRQQLVTTREEERRRLRRDLHDGLGPVLASQGLKIAAASELLESDPSKARQLLVEIGAQNETTLEEIRELVYALRPSALDELGLVGAVRDFSAALNNASNSDTELQIDILETTDGLPPLPAAIEVAAYRIVTEALTNVTRHSNAHRCEVSITVESRNGNPALLLDISDDGIGMPSKRKPSVGMTSMRERAEEIGGTIRIESEKDRGTRVYARLPFAE